MAICLCAWRVRVWYARLHRMHLIGTSLHHRQMLKAVQPAVIIRISNSPSFNSAAARIISSLLLCLRPDRAEALNDAFV